MERTIAYKLGTRINSFLQKYDIVDIVDIVDTTNS